jgi:putative glutamine amidotransferase
MTSERPVIGVCATFERARWSFWDQEAALVPSTYLRAIQGAGAFAVILPPDEAAAASPAALVGLLDGLLLIGGLDLDPASYGAVAQAATGPTSPLRDAFELALVREALRVDLPLLGVCRGMQILNVALGGTLRQDLAGAGGRQPHRRTAGSFDGNDHELRLDAGSLAAAAAGERVHTVHCHHHQAIDRLGEGLRVTARAEDGVIEAVELARARFALGVQWHPEANDKSRVLGALVRAALRSEAASA